MVEPPGVDAKVESADGYGAGDEQGERDVGVDDGVEVMKEETAGPGVEAGAGFEGLLGEGEWAVDGEGFDQDAPDKRGDMEGGEPGAAAGEEGSGDDPEDPGEMDGNDEGWEDFEESGHRSWGEVDTSGDVGRQTK